MSVEYELVPFCNLPQHLMFELQADGAHREESEKKEGEDTAVIMPATDGPVDEAQLLRCAKAATAEVIEECLHGPREVQAKYQEYAYLFHEEVSADIDPLDVEAVRVRTEAYLQAGTEIEKLTTEVVKFPLFELHCQEIIQSMSQRAYYLAACCLQSVAQNIQERSQAVLTEWQETHERIGTNPEDEEELAKLKQFMADLPQLKTKPLMQTTRHIHTQINMLADFSFDIDTEVVERAFSSFAWPLQIQIDVGDSERSLDSQKQKFMEKLDREKTEYERDMARYQEDLEWVKSLNDYSLAMKCAHRIYSLRENLDRAKERVQSFLERERLFGMDVSDYSAVENMIEAFEPYYKLWTSAIDFKHSEEEWLTGMVQRLVAEEIETVVEEQYKESYKTIKQFEGNENPLAVAKDLREEISSFRANMPVIRALCQEAFEPRHFADLFEELRMDMDMEDGITLQQMLDVGILDHIDTLERISVKAQKEHGLKTALATMKKEWRPIEFGLVPHKAGTHMVRGIDEIQAVLDDHIVKTMGIRGSPFVEPIEKEVKDWLQKLTYIQDLLEQWLAMQRSWLYLEPIFSSDDIQKQLPNEAKRFQQVNGLWRTTMESVAENPNVLDVSEIENLLASFIDANKKLDAIQKGLNDYLETKRMDFPRFFFLSNDELLMILSQTKDPTAVQPHMGKCFEGISRVRFNQTSEIIEAMSSVEGEVVELSNPVNVAEGEKKGNVEKWLMEVQGSMIESLTKVTGSSLVAYAKTDRAGLAGLTALEQLSAAGLRCVVLDAQTGPGGRLRGRYFCGRWVEEGANWVQGLGKNPIWKRAQRCALHGRLECTDGLVFRGLGKKGPKDLTKEAQAREKVLTKANRLVEMGKAGRGRKPDLGLAQALAHRGWVASTVLDRALEFWLVDFEYGESAERVSVKHNVHGEYTWNDFGSESVFIDDPRGFSTICPRVPEGVNCYFDTVAEQVVQHADFAQVLCQNGLQVRSRVVLCTVSVGVLNSGSLRFDPPLPAAMQAALGSMTMCNYTKTFVKLDAPLWVPGESYIIRVGEPSGRHVVWQPLGPDMALVTNTGDEGRRVEKLSSEDLKRELSMALADMYENSPGIMEAEATGWSSDPHFRGAYSFLPTGSMAEGWDAISEPHGRVFFAGEAFHPRWSGYLQEQLSGLVNLVRGDLSKLGRQTLGALVTIDVHNRDVVQSLKEAKISSAKEFDWIAQLRYYWRPKGSITLKDTGKASTVDKCEVSIINATLYYGFEYLGNSDRLVITPLTDRCYRTLMGAFHLYYGGGPEGPAGTGKTESTKDLAKAVAVQCVVFNCSDGLDYIAMGKFFKGIASSGAWCCFDEFNRINLEVLSVVSQQVQTIQFAIRDKKEIFYFEDRQIRLVPSCAVNITMNPGYAGRSELPDNLKALFRPCAMMVPDYALIGEIVLYSNGFEDAKNLARKAVGSLRLSSEQLSSQEHYDFGMRALKSILVRAGALRRIYGSTREEQVLALSALSDVNLPKFTRNDIPLFLGITGDLFPEVELPPSDYGVLINELEGSARRLVLQPQEGFIKKCIQLWETIMVRHGLMLVGQTVSGKTEVENVLADALAAVADGENYLPVLIHKINPKSIKQGQLYGENDENTQEWSDGILALTVRHASAADQAKRQWILLDGPVDAVWVENLNTVLDDNKKLCLNSGEIIKLTPVTTMMFEVEDLAVASPATVSRCGMVFLEQSDIGWRVLALSWCERLPDRLKDQGAMLQEMMEYSVECCWEMVSRKVSKPVPVSLNWLVLNLLHLFWALIQAEIPLDEGKKDLPTKEKESKLEALFWLSLLWSFGCVADEDGRSVLDPFFRRLCTGQSQGMKDDFQLLCAEPAPRMAAQTRGGPPPFPDEGSVFDYFPAGNKWELWSKKIGSFDIPHDAQAHSLIIPTSDTVRNAFFLQMLIKSEYHVLFAGSTGTGKTVVIQQQLLKGFDREKYNTFAFAFSAQSSANQTQDVIDGKLDKRKKGCYGPPFGKRCLVFVDDLNMPAKEKYGAQPPLELLRQWMDTSGWYERKTCEFRQLVDLNFIAAMTPSAGRPQITARYLRHYNYFYLLPFQGESLQRIFQTVMQWFLAKFPSQVSSLSGSVVRATVDVYHTISASMLPTPAKSHYTFNLRDLAKVNQGLCLCSKESLPGADDFLKCWVHECQRVFQDRLVNGEDNAWFVKLLEEKLQEHFKKQWKSIIKQEPLIFIDFADSKNLYYQQVTNLEHLDDVLKNRLMDYNSMAKRSMELVLFTSAAQHICRIVRVLKTPLGNALLVGVGGSGRKSLATLATFVAEYDQFSIEITKNYSVTDWHDEIKRLLMSVGGSNQVTFLLADTQIPKESFLEDTSSLLNNGEVPNLFNAEDKTQILEVSATAAAAAGCSGPAEILAFFTEQCRKNLHLILALSPIGDAFRRRVRMFPAIVNCCTIDWFMEWPQEALRSVATHFLQKVDLAQDVFSGVVEICVRMQESVFGLTDRFRREVQRHYYVTPTSYLELINSFKDVLASKREEVSSAKRRYDDGLEKVISTEEQVKTMSIQLEELRPVLKQTSAETAELMTVIERSQEEASATQAVVAKEEEAASQQAEASRTMKEECQADLDKALPALNAALDALKSLKKGDIVEVKNMKSPPEGVITVSKALCWMFDVKPKKVTAEDGRTKIDDYWEPSKKSLWGDPKMLDRLLGFDKDHIPVEVIEKLKPLEDDPEFDPEVIKKASLAAMGICKWVRAMIVYDGVAKVVGPKKEALAGAEVELAKVMSLLKEKKDELKAVQDNVAQLLADFETARQKKDDLAVQVDDCSKRLVRAEKLISGLGGEKSRWMESSKNLGEQYTNLTGDVLIGSGIIAYLGTFTGRYRVDTVKSWVQLMKDNQLPSAQEFSLRTVLGDEVQIRQWVIDKLPNDQVSVENAIIIQRSRRWPLMIDPQLQANQWVRKTYAGQGELRILRLTQNYARELESAIAYGKPVLLENVLEQLDPLLEPLLQKAIFKAGSVLMIRLGDSQCEYNKDFRLFITTKLPNPHYSPEVCVQVTLLNFMATPDGLQDQMLGILVAKEEPEVERKRQNLVVESAQSKAQLKEIEDRILQLLSDSKGNILDDEELINTLATSKTASLRIEERVAEQEKTQAQVQETRATYVPVAVRASALFFVVADLCNVEPMYQYSLEWFYSIYESAIAAAEKFERNIQKRLTALQSKFLELLFAQTCHSLFEKDKLMLSLLLTFKSMEVDDDINLEEKRLLLLALGGGTAHTPKPADWLTDKMWSRICVLDKLGKGPWYKFANSFKDNVEKWKNVFDSDNPLAEHWPGKEQMSALQRALVLLAVRTDCTVAGLQEVIASNLGKGFLEPPSFNLEKAFHDAASPCKPLIFVLSPGADPMVEVIRLAQKLAMNDKYITVSLGQGQGPKAGRAIKDGVDQGMWVILQNCHLAPSWMPTLEVMVEELTPDKVADQFRLWLTAMPSPEFPISVLQNGMKMTIEPPKGLKSNLLRAFSSIDHDWFVDACGKSTECKHTFRKMLFGLCFFHALIQERCTYGPLGWNIPYQFSEPDRQICMMQLRMFLEENDIVPYAALQYTAAEANYGGRVTDVHDRRCINFLLSDFYCPDILKDDYKFSPSGIYYAPAYSSSLEPYVEYIRNLPINQMPEAFGLHANANLVAAISEAMRLLGTAASLQPKTGGGGAGVSQDDIITEAATTYLQDVKPPFDTEASNVKYPVDYNESMNTVLNQELLRFNKLIVKVRSTLTDVGKAVKGLVVMSPELEEVADGILTDRTPSVWIEVSYPSLKPMVSYVADLCERVAFFTKWLEEGTPVAYWLSGFYFTQSFLTGQLQNYARKLHLPIDTLIWNFRVLKLDAEHVKPTTGCLAYGIFMDGARWDDVDGVIAESFPKVLLSVVPTVHLTPCEVSKDPTDRKAVYPSPLYKTSGRKGTLTTTGHSTNFVMTLLLPITRMHTEKYWTKRGVACLLQRDD
ncbi:unnamed protein product [Effrenium voratum]|uniref:Dynein heavy chain n=1 Tax=Effrenium voratum TaxID=2562239 RepID=A0AA36HPK1_9DINO|nr:unnamed protein product [Effrenium voratum]